VDRCTQIVTLLRRVTLATVAVADFSAELITDFATVEVAAPKKFTFLLAIYALAF
jgi:hypothetical protein